MLVFLYTTNKQQGGKTMIDPFHYTEAELYQLIYEEGKRKFSSECEHEKTKNGYCINCLRKVITQQRPG